MSNSAEWKHELWLEIVKARIASGAVGWEAIEDADHVVDAIQARVLGWLADDAKADAPAVQ